MCMARASETKRKAKATRRKKPKTKIKGRLFGGLGAKLVRSVQGATYKEIPKSTWVTYKNQKAMKLLNLRPKR